jgi:hypothetical protein
MQMGRSQGGHLPVVWHFRFPGKLLVVAPVLGVPRVLWRAIPLPCCWYCQVVDRRRPSLLRHVCSRTG